MKATNTFTRKFVRAVTSATAVAILGAKAFAADTTGETFVFDWTETSGSNVGLTGTIDLTLGPASSRSGFFDISSFAIAENGGLCGVCTAKSENLSGMLFDATTNGLLGDVTGTYINNQGKTKTFTLTLTDLPAGMWTFVNGGGKTAMGTYTTSAAVTGVDEPATIFLLIPAAMGLAIALRRRRSP